MSTIANNKKRAAVELEDLRNRLREAEETLSAIRNGEVDSLIVAGPSGDQVFSLKGAEQPYRVFVEQMLEGAVTLTPDGTILYCNRRFAEMVKSRLEKVIGSQLQRFVRPEDHAALIGILSDRGPRKERCALLGGDGSLTWAQFSFSKLPIDDAEAICLVVTDLTEHEAKRDLQTALENLRAVEEELRARNDELELAREAAEAANKAKDDFLAALSHELRTPLTPVLLTVTSLESDPSISPAARDELTLLRRNVEMEARLIDDLLDVTRIARGKIELKLGVVDVHSAIAGALEICRSDVEAKRLALTTDLSAGEVRVAGDAVRIQQILWNLIRNAVKFTPDGGRITVHSHSSEDAIVVAIQDTGIGIDPDDVKRIFAPFEQTNRFITRRFGGLGLGLTISRRLAELHGGTLSAHSDGRDRGATFTLVLPLAEAQDASDLSPDGQSAASQQPRQLRILLVEDHDDTRRSMARLLGRQHHVHDVPDVASALKAADAQQFDLLISDLGLPDGSGLDLMRQLRQRYQLKGICLSGFGMEEDISRSAEAGFDQHLTKPIDLRKLESAIDAVSN